MSTKARSGIYVVCVWIFLVLWVLSFTINLGWAFSTIAINDAKPTTLMGQEFIHSGGEISFAGFIIVNLSGESYGQNFVPWLMSLMTILLLSAVLPLFFSVVLWVLGRIAVRVDRKRARGGVPAHA